MRPLRNSISAIVKRRPTLMLSNVGSWPEKPSLRSEARHFWIATGVTRSARVALGWMRGLGGRPPGPEILILERGRPSEFRQFTKPLNQVFLLLCCLPPLGHNVKVGF